MDEEDSNLPTLQIKSNTDIPHKERFKSLREEMSKAEGKTVRLELDPTDVLGYAFV